MPNTTRTPSPEFEKLHASAHARAFAVAQGQSNYSPHMADDAKALLDEATKRGAEKLRQILLSGRAAMPSAHEIEAELGRDFFKQTGDVVIVGSADNGATR